MQVVRKLISPVFLFKDEAWYWNMSPELLLEEMKNDIKKLDVDTILYPTSADNELSEGWETEDGTVFTLEEVKLFSVVQILEDA